MLACLILHPFYLVGIVHETTCCSLALQLAIRIYSFDCRDKLLLPEDERPLQRVAVESNNQHYRVVRDSHRVGLLRHFCSLGQQAPISVPLHECCPASLQIPNCIGRVLEKELLNEAVFVVLDASMHQFVLSSHR